MSKADRGLTISRMVELGEVSRSSFYRFDGDRPARRDDDMELRSAIQRIALEFPCYGRPRITAELKRRGWKVNLSGWAGSCVRTTYCACANGRSW